VYPIVIAIGRRIITDDDFHGCPMRQGQMVQFMITGPNRDPSLQERATEVDLDREIVRHTSFGLGIHRCLGSHIARQEIIIGVEEWTRCIPDYEVATDDDLTERSGIPIALQGLPLRWPT
jgi:cytochrome P450